MFIKTGVITLFTLLTALRTLFPPNSSSLSRSSTASNLPLEAPDGTDAIPDSPENSITSTSSVGFPRESRI